MSIDQFGDGEFESAAHWDEALASALIGKTLLLELTFLNEEDEPSGNKQIFGTVVSCDPVEGIVLAEDGTEEEYVIAPFLDAIEPAPPGHYRLVDQDRTVENPDYMAMMAVMLAE